MVEAQPRTAPVQPSGRPSPDAAGDVPIMEDLTPAQIVAELDRFIIGQGDAKRAVAVALRNRFRRQLLPEEMRGEVVPKNILMMGPTGVGKTEIARRVAKIVDAPFVIADFGETRRCGERTTNAAQRSRRSCRPDRCRSS